MSVMVTTEINGLPDYADEGSADHPGGQPVPAPTGKLMRLPAAVPEQRTSRSSSDRPTDGTGMRSAAARRSRRRSATHGSCPDDATWDVISWNDLYGE